MSNKKRNLKKILPVAALAVPLIMAGQANGKTGAAEGKSLFNLKLLIFNNAQYEASYDMNANNTVDIFDMIRIKQKQYGIGSSGLEPAVSVTVSETSPVVTSPALTYTESPETTESISTTVFLSEPGSEPSVTESAPAATQASETSSVTTEPPATAVTTTLPVTTASETTTQPAVTTTVTTTTSPVTTTTVTTTTPPVTTTVTTTTAPPVTTAAPVTTLPSKKIISSVKSFVQGPELPTGCEATGLAIAVRWYGYNVDKVDMAMKYMPRQDFERINGRLTGADFRTTFAGDPSREDMSYGCYIPCMISTVDNYFKAVGSSYRGKDISGKELEDLFPYIAQNKPVILISTPELVTPRPGDSWYTRDGRLVQWQRGHHCMVLIGYDKTRQRVYCADPMMRAGIVSWGISEFKNIYNQKGKNAMIIDTGAIDPPKRTLKAGDTVRFAGWVNSASEGNGTETFLDTNVYTITKIHPNTSLPNPVCIGNIGWASYDSLYENIAYYGDGKPSGNEQPPAQFPSSPPSQTPDTATIENGAVYNISNAKTGKLLNVDYGHDTDGTNIYQWSSDNSTEQKFKLKADGDAWKIMAMCSSSGENRMTTASATSDGANVYLYKAVNNTTQQWIIKKSGGNNAYSIGLKAFPGYVLTVSDDKNGSASGASGTSAGNVFISKYTGADNQLWYFTKN